MTRPLIIDGGLATSLEAKGIELHPRLWSAGVFLEDRGAIEELHVEFLEAGADIIVTASYQMSFEGLAAEGMNDEQAIEALRGTIEVADRARARANRPDALIAASVGPYGAMLCDGSEYQGKYGKTVLELADFHRRRLEILSSAGADFLAIETIPSIEEAEALIGLLEEVPGPPAWMSFTCRSGTEISDGSDIRALAFLCSRSPRISAIGVNCTAPELVDDLIREIKSCSEKNVLVYPNSGEGWDSDQRGWTGNPSDQQFLVLARRWAELGSWAIGGCCRIGPDVIRRVAGLVDGG